MNMHTNESNVHKQCEFAQMYYQALAKKSSTTHKNVEPRERNMKPQKQLQLSHAHNSRCFTHASRSAHTNKSNLSAGGGGTANQHANLFSFAKSYRLQTEGGRRYK